MGGAPQFPLRKASCVYNPAPLSDALPDAKFVHIHRHPHEVFQSTVHTWKKVYPLWALQEGAVNAESVIRDYADVYDSFFEHRHLIPAKNYCEIAFDQLEKDPLGQIKYVYETLSLPDFDYAEPKLRDYVQSLQGYSRNTFPKLPSDVRERLAREWARCFEEWQYQQ